VDRTLNNALEMAVRTDPGKIRGHNEDAVFANPALGIAILADGMGGYNAGEVASSMTTTLLSAELEEAFAVRPPHEIDRDSGLAFAHRCLLDKVAVANAAIFTTAQSQPQYAGMGTTLVAAVFYDNQLTVAHIGDSRLYRLRGDLFCSITRDHSLLQEQIDCGFISVDEARFSQNKNLVLRALGVDPEVDTEINDYPVQPGDIYLLCSDGLNDMVEDEEIQHALQSRCANLDLAATQLIQLANDNGGADNVSVILVKIVREFPAPRSGWSKLLSWLK
jgi:serine/threonine protein phosphatase PrpC